MADDFEIRMAALDAAADLHIEGYADDLLIARAEKIYSFLLGVPASAPAQPADEPGPLPAEAPADASAAPVVQDNSADQAA